MLDGKSITSPETVLEKWFLLKRKTQRKINPGLPYAYLHLLLPIDVNLTDDSRPRVDVTSGILKRRKTSVKNDQNEPLVTRAQERRL